MDLYRALMERDKVHLLIANRDAERVYDMLSADQQWLVNVLALAGDEATLLEMLSRLYNVDQVQPTTEAGIFMVTDDSSDSPVRVDVYELTCECDRRTGRGEFVRNAGMCSHLLAAILRAIELGQIRLSGL